MASTGPGERDRADEALGAKIDGLFVRHRRIYGSPRWHRALRRAGHACGRHRVARLSALFDYIETFYNRERLHTKTSFVPVAFRWRIERTFAWFGQCRLLSKEHGKTVASAEAWLWCAMMRLLVRRLSC